MLVDKALADRTMNDTLVYKRSLTIGVLTMLRLVAPAAIAIGMLVLMARAFDRPFEDHFLMLSVLLGLLSPLVFQRPANSRFQLVSRGWSAAGSLFVRWVVLLLILLVIGYVTKLSPQFSRLVIASWAVLTPAPLILASLGLDEVLRRVMYSSSNARRAVFAGFNEVSLQMAEGLKKHRELGISVAGFFDDRSAERLGLDAEDRLLGGLPTLARYVNQNAIDVIFIALPMRHVQRVMDLLEDLRDTTASIYYVPDIFVFDLIQARTGQILGMPVVAMCETPFHGYRGVVKRLMDVSFSAIGLLVLAPFLAVVALLVKLTSPGPVIFRQRRYGLDGQEIGIYKFRTMAVTEDGDTIRQASKDDSRITRLGRFLRRYSIDELPQLVNVLQGTMSLIGPRPHAVAHNEEYRKQIKGYMIRHKVLPGMTGLAQVSGCRGETKTLEQMQARVRYDLEYLRRWSPALDFMIIVKTALLVFYDRNAY
jgi:putative colanic acid biosynthesis UDP-glucose lipid carrier transferase